MDDPDYNQYCDENVVVKSFTQANYIHCSISVFMLQYFVKVFLQFVLISTL